MEIVNVSLTLLLRRAISGEWRFADTKFILWRGMFNEKI